MEPLELFHQAESLTGIGSWALDAQTDQLHWSPQTFQLHGLSPSGDAPTLSQMLGFVVEGDRERVRDAFEAAQTRAQGLDLRYGLLRADGAEHRVHCVAAWRRLPAGDARLVGTLQSLQQGIATSALLGGPLEFAVAAAGVGVWETDFQTGTEVWSDLTLAMYGLPPGSQAPTRQQWREHFLHPEDLARVNARAEEMMAGGRPYEMEYRIRRADDGALRWLYSRATFAFGGARRVWGVTLDVTERRLADERARQAARLLDLAATHVGFGFGYREPGGQEGEWSPQLKRQFGLQASDPTPRPPQLLDLVSERDRARVKRELSTPIGPGQVSEFEFEVKRGFNGQPRTLMTRAVTSHDNPDHPGRTFFALVDLTDLRQQDRREMDLLERLQLATEASGVGTWERDERSDQVRWDAITLNLFGLPVGAAAPDFEQYLALVHPADRERVLADWARVEAEGHSVDIEFRVQPPGGPERWLRSRGRIERDAEGRVVRRIGVCFDTTERRHAEAALQAHALAEQANAAKTEFLSRMSHELRTPLNAVLGFAQLMTLDHADPLSEAQRARVGHIQSAGWHLLALVNDVLDLAKIESRQAQMVFNRVPLAEVVHECLAMTAPLAQAKGVQQQWLQDGGTPAFVWADRTRLKQLLLNLVSNAVKYNRRDGRVQVAAAALPTGEVQISISDTGLGLSQEQLTRLFEPFNRLGRETSGIEGTGIGLALCKLIAEQMGGHIGAESQPGQGCVFRVTLPGVAAA